MDNKQDELVRRKIRPPWAERKMGLKKNVQAAMEANDMEALRCALPVLQRRFAEEYVTDFNAAAACIRAGSKCSPENAHRMGYLLRINRGVQRYVDHLMEERTQNTRVDPGFILTKLVQALNRSEGKNETATLRAIELFMKHLGMLTEKTEITGKDGSPIQYEKMNEDADAFTRAIAGIAKRSGTVENDDRDGGEAGSLIN